MRRPLVLFLALAAFAGVSALLVFVRGSTEPEAGDAPAIAARVAEVSAPAFAPLATAIASEPAGPLHLETENDARLHPERACDGPTIVVRRFVGGGSEPVAGAEVRWCSRVRAFAPRDRTWIADPNAGERFTTDSDGRVRVPSSEHGAAVHVTIDALTGDTELSSLSTGDVIVIVEAAATTYVRVVDHTGDNVPGIGVSLHAQHGERTLIHASSETTENGLATLVDYVAIGSEHGVVWIEPELVQPRPLRIPIERPSTALDPIVVRLPPLGELRVVVMDDARIDAEANGNVTLRLVTTEGPFNDKVLQLPLRDGGMRIGRVGLGGIIRARVSTDSLPWLVEVHGAGPAHDGEEVQLAVRVAELTWIRFRMLDASGDPIRGSTFNVRVMTGGSQCAGRIPSDLDGAVRVPLTDPWKLGDVRYARIEVAALGQALLDLSRDLPAGTTDVGDVHLGDGPRIAAGRVVDEHGEPLSNARVVLVLLDGANSSERFQAGALPRITTGLDGTFELIGVVEPETYGLRVSASGYVTTRRPLVVGETGIVFTLAEYGSIRGNLVFTGEFTPENVEVWVADGNGFERKIAVESKGFFRAVDVAPGQWEVLVRRAKSAEVLARVGGIELAPGGRVELEPIEVREPSGVRR